MTTKEKTHWRKHHPSEYIGSEDLIDADVKKLDVHIVKVELKEVTGPDNRKDSCTVATLKGQKPFIMNVTNCKMVAKVLDSPFIEDWAGRDITLFVARVKAFGEQMDALRVDPKVPAAKVKPELTEDHEKWAGARAAILGGSVTIESIKKTYTLSKEDQLKLEAPVLEGETTNTEES